MLGAGGMGQVWEAEHVVTGRLAAVKVPHPDFAKHPSERALLVREGMVDEAVERGFGATRLTGPGATPIYDVGQLDDGTPYLVMERFKGRTLEAVGRDRDRDGRPRRVTPEYVEWAIDRTLRTLEKAHEAGIIHRDLKPENLFATEGGDLKVLDFGLAQVNGDPHYAGHFVGTPGYAPPEQAIGLTSTPASDVYALGATAYQLLTGRAPTDAEASLASGKKYLKALPMEVAARILKEESAPAYARFPTCPVRPVRSLAPDVPEGLAAVVDRALKCEPGLRYPSAHAMRADLARAVAERLGKVVG